MKKTSPHPAICAYGAGVLLTHLQAARDEVDGVRQARDIENIHRMRVASRRLRAALPIFEGCLPAASRTEWQKELRALTRALGEARDLDVQLDWLGGFQRELPQVNLRAGVRRLALRLSQRRARVQLRVVTDLERLERSHTFDEMETCLRGSIPAPVEGEVAVYPRELYDLAAAQIQRRLDALLAYEPAFFDPTAVTEHHAARIAAKWLRYTLETFAPLYPKGLKQYLTACRNTQDLLGSLHDCDVWGVFLPDFIEKERRRTIQYYGSERPFKRLLPGLTCLVEDRRATRQQVYAQFLKAWQGWQADGLWASLPPLLNRPLEMTASVSPIPRPEPDGQ